MIYDRSKRTDWQIVDVIPTSEIQGRINIIRVLIGLVAVTYLLFLWIMLMLLSKGIVVPISKLADKMDKFSKGNMEIKADDSASGEIGKLNKHFNSMTQHISMLIKENEYETKQKNDFEMKALIAQLNPHFIYNALNTIKWMAVINNQSNIEKLTEALINVLMNSAQSGQEYHLVNDEIELIKSYVIIQKARFMNFSVEYDVTPESEQYVIRKFLIQPVVENSIIHGLLRGKVKNGLIKIRIWTDEYLNVEVSDNGCGFDTDILKDKKHSEDEGYTSLALANIMQIVDIDYGKPYKIEVISILGKGTKIVYLLPLIKKEKSMIKIIIVDDEMLARVGIRSLLDKHSDLRVEDDFDSAQDAIDYLRKHREIDIVITDIEMPGINGLEMIHQILDEGLALSVIILSCHESFKYAKEAISAGADAYILKQNISEDQVIATIHDVMKKRKEIDLAILTVLLI